MVGALPQPVVNVFEQMDFSGKTIIPFGIHFGSRFGRTVTQVEEYEPDATVSQDGLTINFHTAMMMFGSRLMRGSMNWGTKHTSALIDGGMAIALLICMSHASEAQIVHEISGIVLDALVILHQIRSRRWYRSLGRPKHGKALARPVINVALLVAVVLMAVSGILMNEKTLPFLHVSGAVNVSRRIHLAANGWFFTLTAVHAGLHMRIPRNKVLLLIETAVLIIGVVFFVQSDLWHEMFLLTEYAFIDYEAGFVGIFVRDLVMFAGITALSSWLDHSNTAMIRQMKERP